MIVCLDSGNSRIKWGVLDGDQWLARGAVDHARVAELSALIESWPTPSRVMLANVAGDEVVACLREHLAPWSGLFHQVRPQRECCGVRNHYANPAQLGVDRWCALLGARALHDGSAVIVMAGTATTIDTLDAEGNFLGGMILPGIDLMRHSLARDTAALPLAVGEYSPLPRCTADAIFSGVLEAQVGAIERACLRVSGNAATCLLSGGNATLIAARLSIPNRLVDNLPLEGLRRIAVEA